APVTTQPTTPAAGTKHCAAGSACPPAGTSGGTAKTKHSGGGHSGGSWPGPLGPAAGTVLDALFHHSPLDLALGWGGAVLLVLLTVPTLLRQRTRESRR